MQTEAYTVKEFAEEAFNVVGMNWEDFVVTSKDYERPNEVKYLLGDSSKAKSELNWEPETNFKQLVKMMVENDLKLAEQEKSYWSMLITPTWENQFKLPKYFPKPIIRLGKACIQFNFFTPT